MAIEWFSVFYWFVGVLSGLLFLGGLVYFSLLGGGYYVSDLFYLDYVSFILGFLSLFLLFSFLGWGVSLSWRCRVLVFFSIFMSMLCYCSFNMLFFWVTYELSILPLLYLLVVESPYSERYLASWYFGGYIVLTSLPMLLSILYLGSWCGVIVLGFSVNGLSWGGYFSLLVLCLSFITKIPLFPFHSWLPVVHAESSSPVSVCLSGYIMKLGVLGVFRFGYMLLSDFIFSYPYIFFILCFSIITFLFSCQELDGKRWLAFLSLSHIVFCVVGLGFSGFALYETPFLFCLGHGLSAGLTFLYLWFFYNLSGSRNWSLLKVGMSSGFMFRVFTFVVLCTVASFPTTLCFFSEIRIFVESGYVSCLFFLILFLYLFLGGLIPFFIVGGSLSLHNSVSCFSGDAFSGFSSFLFLVFLCLTLFYLF